MAQYNSLNVKLSNSQLNKLRSAIKNETKVVLRLSSNMICDDETNFLPYRLLGPLLKTGSPLIKNVIKHKKKRFNSFRINCSSISSRSRIHKKYFGIG